MLIDPNTGVINILKALGTLSVGQAPVGANGLARIAKIFRKTATVTFASIAAQAAEEVDVTVTGVAVGDIVIACPSTNLGNVALAWRARIKAANTISISVINPTAGAINPSDVDWSILVICLM
jgi:hypothetical protein